MQFKEQIKGFFLFLAFLIVLRLFFVDAYNIPSRSMEPTLLQGDFILTNKLVYKFADPRRGDIVVFVFPYQNVYGSHLIDITFIKRVVGVPGDVVSFKDGFLSVNGKPLKYEKFKETADAVYYYEYIPSENGRVVKHPVKYLKEPPFLAFLGRHGVKADTLPPGACLKRDREYPDFCSEVKVPEGYYLVMGDNRDNSEDGRYWGLLARKYILSTPFVIYFSGEVPSLTPEESSIFSGIKQLFHALLHPRFERIGKPLVY